MPEIIFSNKKKKNTFNLPLQSINKNSITNRRIKHFMFKIVCKTPPFTKKIAPAVL